MSIRIGIHHKTCYSYDRPIALTPHVLRLRPAPHARTPVTAYSLRIEPEQHFINWQQDPFGNFLARVVFPEKVSRLSIEVDLVADMTVINPFDFFLEESAQKYPFAYAPRLRHDLAPYLETAEDGALLRAWLDGVDRRPRPVVDFLVALNQRLCAAVEYSVRMEPGVQTCEQTLGRAVGSCRDSAWLLVQILRHLGLAARFASGYLVQLVPDEKALDGPSGPAEDFTDLHAWAEVYVPGAGWIGLDPTSGLFAGEGHIPLACTPDPAGAAPVEGAAEPCEVEFSFDNGVTRLHESPRVTRPYSEPQWQAIEALGERVDRDLEAGDVRLTMGGEPTFVSIDDMDAAEWNTAADGPQKRQRAADLARRLQRAFARGGALHHGQGKLYPGEVLPRWQITCFWREDGAPLWRDGALQADSDRDYGHDATDAERFIRRLAADLKVDGDHVAPAYEDIYYYLWQEQKLAPEVDPYKADLKDPAERRALARLLERDPGEPAGYVLPLDRETGAWRSAAWTFRRDRLHLVPGDSPLGLRLPLDSLPWVPPAQRPNSYERPLTQPLPPLPDPGDGDTAAGHGDDAFPVRTALCLEAREGRLHVFMPPLERAEDYLHLLEAVEGTAAALGLPVVLEGYEPPTDPRLKQFKLTPDPGVLEVNVHPARSWKELAAITTTLYEEARLARLGTEKFMLDGRHTGTGGGNHVTVGGQTPADSPLLRRPDLLRSLITYWQNHPGLSYLFSGTFIGPTSQAPRVDEGRDETLYELEIALSLVPEDGSERPWLVDRLLRHLLVDLTGNTHRAEFCIDKLYSPDSQSGRLGLLELRAFEMPPHSRMSLVQALLLRSLIARFWRMPYRRRLVRWGTELHDRFMLPHFVRGDLKEVASDLKEAGYAFDHEWLEPFLEFRFPLLGRVDVGDMSIEVRRALEPWHVLGEEVARTGTARFVDSSMERLQVKLEGLTEGRYILACNGRRLPLRPTGTPGEYVVGVRYRAWQPPSALHPTIAVHSPLVFDVVDTWNGRAVGGCTCHVAHPGGRHYETFPVNANEAEARRTTLFRPEGHTPGPIEVPPALAAAVSFEAHSAQAEPTTVPPAENNEAYPHTLDLRQSAPEGR